MSAESSAGVDPSGARAVALGLDGALGEGPADVLVRTAFAGELLAQATLVGDLSLADLAHTVMLVEGDVIPSEAGARTLAALLELHGRPGSLTLDPAGGDAYTNREAWLLAYDPATAWLGAGRARREATTTAFHLATRRRLVRLVGALLAMGSALVERATIEQATLVPDYTYLQAAQPTTFGHYLLGFVGPIRRDLDRAIALFERVDRSPAGIGSGNGSLIPQDRERLAALLGFGGLVDHGRDAVWPVDLTIEAGALAAAAAVNLDRLAEDLLVFASGPFGFVELADSHARASRVLPQKRNPFALTHVRAVANRAIGHQAAIAAAGRMPTGQPDTRSVAAAATADALDEVTGAAELLSAVVRTMRIDAERCLAALASSDAAASDLAAVLVRDGGGAVDVRSAHRVVARLVADLRASGRPLGRAEEADLLAAAAAVGVAVTVPHGQLRSALDPQAAVDARIGTGGASPSAMAALLEGDRAALARAETWRATSTVRLVAAETALVARARTLAGRP